MTSCNAAVVAAVGLAVLGAAWLFGSPGVALVGAVVFLPPALRLAADYLSRGVAQ